MKSVMNILASIALLFGSSAGVTQTRMDGFTTQRPWLDFPGTDRSLIIVKAVVNGKPVDALVDTGFSGVVLSKRFAIREGLPLKEVGSAYSVGGMQQFYSTPHVKLTIDDISGPDDATQVADFDEFQKSSGVSFDVVVGASFIAAFGLEIDFDQRRLRFQAQERKPASALTVLISYDGRRFTMAALSSGQVVSPILIDLGSNASLSLTEAVAKSITRDRPSTTDLEYVGAGGSEIEKVFNNIVLHIDNADIGNFITTVAPNATALDRMNLSGSIGLGLLARYNVVIDARRSTMTLIPRVYAPPSGLKTTVGVQGSYEPQRIVVTHVMKNSPAEKAGLIRGDDICAINGVPIVDAWRGSPMRLWGTVAPGKKYLIGLCNGRNVTLTTASFY